MPLWFLRTQQIGPADEVTSEEEEEEEMGEVLNMYSSAVVLVIHGILIRPPRLCFSELIVTVCVPVVFDPDAGGQQDIEDLDHYEMKEEEPADGKKSEDDGIEKENLAILEKIRKNQRQDHLNVSAHSVGAPFFYFPFSCTTQLRNFHRRFTLRPWF